MIALNIPKGRISKKTRSYLQFTTISARLASSGHYSGRWKSRTHRRQSESSSKHRCSQSNQSRHLVLWCFVVAFVCFCLGFVDKKMSAFYCIFVLFRNFGRNLSEMSDFELEFAQLTKKIKENWSSTEKLPEKRGNFSFGNSCPLVVCWERNREENKQSRSSVSHDASFHFGYSLAMPVDRCLGTLVSLPFRSWIVAELGIRRCEVRGQLFSLLWIWGFWWFIPRECLQCHQTISSMKQGCDMPDSFYFVNYADPLLFPCTINIDAMHSPITAGYFVQYALSGKFKASL